MGGGGGGGDKPRHQHGAVHGGEGGRDRHLVAEVDAGQGARGDVPLPDGRVRAARSPGGPSAGAERPEAVPPAKLHNQWAGRPHCCTLRSAADHAPCHTPIHTTATEAGHHNRWVCHRRPRLAGGEEGAAHHCAEQHEELVAQVRVDAVPCVVGSLCSLPPACWDLGRAEGERHPGPAFSDSTPPKKNCRNWKHCVQTLEKRGETQEKCG